MNFDPQVADYDSGAHKLLSDNRAAYFAQSANTRDGQVADYAREQQQDEHNEESQQ